ncbi:DUF1254 domain-containing protein [Micromonospora matsumotoense]
MVLRVNFDTLYANCWLDLTAGPVTCTCPTATTGCCCVGGSVGTPSCASRALIRSLVRVR